MLVPRAHQTNGQPSAGLPERTPNRVLSFKKRGLLPDPHDAGQEREKCGLPTCRSPCGRRRAARPPSRGAAPGLPAVRKEKVQFMISSRTSNTDTNGLGSQRNASAGRGVAGHGIRLMGETLVREFSAPVGIFDPGQRAWTVILGAAEEQFPGVDSLLQEVASSSGLRLGRVAVWRRDEDLERSWLVLPLPSAEAADLVSFVGFLAPPQPRDSVPRPTELAAPEPRDLGVWGPASPEPA